MADEKKPASTVVTLVAVERGFVRGRLVEPGKSFEFNTVGADGKPRKLPKWAVPAGDPKLSRPKPQSGDLKPKEAQAASKEKTDGLTAGLV